MQKTIFQNISTGERNLLILGGLLILVALFGCNHIIELRAEEPRRAIVSIEMLLSHNYLVPEINGWPYYNKPPLFNWWMVLFFKIFGSFDEWVVRGSSLFAFLICAISNYILMQKHLGKKVALLSSLFLVSSADLLFYGTVNAGEIDLFFTCITYLQVISIFCFFDKKQYAYLFIVSYFFAALGTLTKGPPSIAFQALTLLSWLVFQKKWKMLFSLQHILGILVFILIVGGYFYWYSSYGDSIGYMTRLFKEAAQRTGMEQSFGDVILGTFQFPALLLKLLAPWSLLLVLCFVKIYSLSSRRPQF